MSPIIVTALKELAKVAIPIIANKIVEAISENAMTQKSLPTSSNSIDLNSYMNFSDVELEYIIKEFKQHDLVTALNNLKMNGYTYNLRNDDNIKSLAIYKNGKRLIIN